MRVLSFDVGTKTLSYCLLVKDDTIITIEAWESINIHDEAGLSDRAKPTMKEDAEYVVDALLRRQPALWAGHPDVVIVEQQPAGGNNRFCSVRMKSLSHVIHSFFYTMQRVSGVGGMGVEATIIPVTFVSPASKLTGMASTETQQETEARQAGDRRTMGAKYRNNKRYAVDTITALLDTMDPQLATTRQARFIFAAAAPKQDDLSDCACLALAFTNKTIRKRKSKTKK